MFTVPVNNLRRRVTVQSVGHILRWVDCSFKSLFTLLTVPRCENQVASLKFGGWPQNTVGEMREKWRHSAGWFSFSGGGEEGALPNLLAGFPSVVGRGGRHGKISF